MNKMKKSKVILDFNITQNNTNSLLTQNEFSYIRISV